MAAQFKIEQLDALCDAFNQHDLESVLAHFSEDGEFLAPTGPETYGACIKGKAALREAFEHLFAACPDIKWVGQNFSVSDNQALSSWRRTATLEDGTIQDWMGCDIYTFEEGLVTCKDSYFKIRG
jgi:ketosteroid isomerase-like protein